MVVTVPPSSLDLSAIGMAGDLIQALGAIPGAILKSERAFLTRASLIVHRDSVRNAPRSPYQGQKQAVRKTTRDTSKQRKPTAFSRAKPGGLERSLSREVRNTYAKVFVALNSEAGRYAERIHDGKGTEWFNRGNGTVAKGPQADEKFIERAAADNESALQKIWEDEMMKAVKL